jgi:hypothetical protein
MAPEAVFTVRIYVTPSGLLPPAAILDAMRGGTSVRAWAPVLTTTDTADQFAHVCVWSRRLTDFVIHGHPRVSALLAGGKELRKRRSFPVRAVMVY